MLYTNGHFDEIHTGKKQCWTELMSVQNINLQCPYKRWLIPLYVVHIGDTSVVCETMVDCIIIEVEPVVPFVVPVV